MTTTTRGSARLIDAYRERGVPLDEALVAKLSDSLGDFDVHDVFVRGIPAPDFFRAGFTVKGSEQVAKTVADVLGTVATVPGAQIRVFPKGIPWPEVFHVELTLAQG